MKCYTIWDIDNCLADDQWRLPLVNWKKIGDDRYEKYNRHACEDMLRHRHEFAIFAKIAEPVFFSGRPEMMRTMTLDWLKAHLVDDGLPAEPKLYLRENNTVGLSPRKCKEAMLHKFWNDLPDSEECQIIAAFDDIPSIIEMYRSYDIPATELAIHGELLKAYTPQDLL